MSCWVGGAAGWGGERRSRGEGPAGHGGGALTEVRFSGGHPPTLRSFILSLLQDPFHCPSGTSTRTKEKW